MYLLYVAALSCVQVLLVLQLSTSPALGDASITSVTEYLLTQPIFSFTLSGKGVAVASTEQELTEEDSEGEDSNNETSKEFDSRRSVVLLKLHCVHSRCIHYGRYIVTFCDCFPSKVHARITGEV